MKNFTEYVLGFRFSPDFRKIVLIRKARPKFQAGKLNAVGGHVEEGESHLLAMPREFWEETSVKTQQSDWYNFGDAISQKSQFKIHLSSSVGDIDNCKTNTDEVIEIHLVDEILRNRDDAMGNLFWLTGVALDSFRDRGPKKIHINYDE